MANHNFNRDWDYDYTNDYMATNSRSWNQTNRWNTNPYWDQGTYNPNWNRYNRGAYNPYYDYDYDYNNWNYNAPTWTYWEYWYVPGPYVGIGPSEYQRSDDQIRDDIHNRMTQHGRLDASDIHVDVNNGVVTLTGNVPDRRQKRLAEDIADSVTGVIDVQNNLHVERGRQGQSQSGMQRKQTQKGEISRGMNVVGSDGKQAGTVKDIRNNDFLLDRSMDRDVFVPFSAIQNIQNNQIQLNIKADDVDNQGWPEPQVVGTRSQQGR